MCIRDRVKTMANQSKQQQIDADHVYYKTQQMSTSNNKQQPDTNEIGSEILGTTLR